VTVKEQWLVPGNGCLSLGDASEAGSAAPTASLGQRSLPRRGTRARACRLADGAARLRACAQVVAYGISINLVEVTWKSKIKAQFPNPNDYSAFMGDFSSATGAVTFIMMLLSRFIFRKARARPPAAAAAAAAPGAGRRVRRACARGRCCFCVTHARGAALVQHADPARGARRGARGAGLTRARARRSTGGASRPSSRRRCC